MKALIIILSVIFILAAIILFVTASVAVGYDESFKFVVKIGFLKVYDSSRHKKNKKPKKSKATAEAPGKPKKQGIVKSVYNKNGFVATVKQFAQLAHDIIGGIKDLLSHFKFKQLMVDITVASDDAAKTAIYYGAVCTAVYPVVGLLSSLTDVGFKQINISSDFKGKKSNGTFSLTVKVRIIYLLIALMRILKIYNDFKLRNGLNE